LLVEDQVEMEMVVVEQVAVAVQVDCVQPLDQLAVAAV
jgi:hypothetical protein